MTKIRIRHLRIRHLTNHLLTQKLSSNVILFKVLNFRFYNLFIPDYCHLFLRQISVVDVDDAAVETDFRNLVVSLQELAKLKKNKKIYKIYFSSLLLDYKL